MSFQMYDGAITVHTDTTPLALDEATRTLYNRPILTNRCRTKNHSPIARPQRKRMPSAEALADKA